VHREAQAMSLQTLSVGERPHRAVSVFAKGASVATTTLSDAQARRRPNAPLCPLSIATP